MLYAGEDPRFVLRRLIILASEDIGLADPMGIVVANAAAQNYELLGMPEGIYPIAHATLYLATAARATVLAHISRPLAKLKRMVPNLCPPI